MCVKPNQSAVLSLFGKYVGTVKENGLRWNNPLFSKRNPKLSGLFLKKFVGNLEQNTNSVSSLTVRVLTGPVLQIFDDREGIADEPVALSPLYVGDRAYPAVVMFKRGVIKPFAADPF